MKKLRLALAQINPIVGDLKGNADMIIDYIGRAKEAGADIVAFPELALTGYPPEDLLLKPGFIDDNLRELKRIRKAVSGIAAIAGFVDRAGENLFNAAAFISDGKLMDVYHKVLLPNYGVFDEHRYFKEGSRSPVYQMGDITLGINICEDIWHPEGPLRMQAMAGAELIINTNASPYSIGKLSKRMEILGERITESPVAVAYLNTVGGQDEIVFDGASIIMDETGELVARAAQFREELLVADISLRGLDRERPDVRDRRPPSLVELGARETIEIKPPYKGKSPRVRLKKHTAELLVLEAEVYEGLKLGVRDYLGKNGFNRGTIIGLSGGIDSALVAAIAVDALGAANVRCVFMPSCYSSSESREDAQELAKNLGVSFEVIAIDELMAEYDEALRLLFKGRKPDVTEENLQARIRGNLLMALSNKTGAIVLTTGNKSEMSVGYATLYGDMAGGFAVIKDVTKTMVYALAEWRNSISKTPCIPQRIITKEPTAELREDQKDSDSLPPYEVLDPILEAYIEHEKSFEEIVELGYGDRVTVERVIGLVDRSEYKRRQSPPGIKVTARAFGKDWRVPITNRYKPR